jgi:hypothetical protein
MKPRRGEGGASPVPLGVGRTIAASEYHVMGLAPRLAPLRLVMLKRRPRTDQILLAFRNGPCTLRHKRGTVCPLYLGSGGGNARA